ncbi:CobW family GTP-binding protein [Cohnella zeiphila]|uniref:GTP-binding protein n=1 Tax=Cohnella zeiphila TaxID=2761120 RepID=A0A7X0VW49_9BACL|nr:GTP-binding protein [Cohnella zeiphila]MBB6732130.1 GTP-binding protein [Cohnella zeiphila]
MKKTPIIILAGFLGAGKTTLLAKLLEDALDSGQSPALIMNEIGDINLDGLAVDENVPQREMLNGCICCTFRADLGTEIRRLADEVSPDVIFIEATGVANPMELLDAATEAALLLPIEIRAVATVVDIAHWLKWRQAGGKTYRLMADQIRCGTVIVLNKADLVTTAELEEGMAAVRELNAHALLYPAVRCEVDRSARKELILGGHAVPAAVSLPAEQSRATDRSQDRTREHRHSYDHVTVYTHYFEGEIEPEWLKQTISRLPDRVYRAKGVFTSAESGERMMFHYAYRQLDVFRINPQGSVRNAAVFIGEQFSGQELASLLERRR